MDKPADQKQAESGSNLLRGLICRQVEGDVILNEDWVPCITPTTSVKSAVDNSSHAGFSSGSGEYVRDPSSILSLQPWIFKRENKVSGNSECEMDCFPNASFCESTRGRSSIRSRWARRRPMRTPGSMEDCLIPQLHSDNFDKEEFVFSSLSSPALVAARPFIITDGRKIISKSGYKHLAVPFENARDNEINGASSRISDPVVGVSPLYEPRKPKRSRDTHHGRVSAIDSQIICKQSHSQGLLDERVILSTGICIGVLFSALSNKRETEKLSDMLKRTENLVQDLQEELEMKNSLTVEELPHDSCGSQEDIHGQKQSPLPKLESISKVEAELEAELERLELNMNANSLQGSMSELGEVDADIGDAVHRELRADMLDRKWKDHARHEDHVRDGKSSSTGCADDPNHPISPRELTLRLHNVIQQRLEERIKELETALAQSQKQLQLMEAERERVLCERVFSNSDTGSSSNQESPKRSMSRESDFVQPFCLNLSGDALNAYDEAYEEFMRVADTKNVKDQKPDWNELPYSADSNLIGEQDHFLKSEEPSVAHDESDDDDDDDDFKLLIRQIVERTRGGSPVMIQAKRMLCSGDY